MSAQTGGGGKFLSRMLEKVWRLEMFLTFPIPQTAILPATLQ